MKANLNSLRTWFFFLIVFIYLFFLGRIGMPLAHDFFDPLVMRDTSLLVSALIDRGVSFVDLATEAMKHLEGPTQFVIMNLYVSAIGDAYPLTPTTMQFPNTILVLIACMFAFLLMRKLFDTRTAVLTVIAFVLPPWLAAVVRLTHYFNTIALALQLSTAYCLVGLAREPSSLPYRIMVPLLLAMYPFSSLEWPSFFLFAALFCITTGNTLKILRNPFNVLLLATFLILFCWDFLLYMRFGTEGLAHTRLLYAFTVSSWGSSSNTLGSIWDHQILGWGPLLLFSYGGLIFYCLRRRTNLFKDRTVTGFLDACGLWLIWSSSLIFWAGGHITYLFVLGVPAAVFSGLLLSRIPVGPVAAIVFFLAVFQVGLITDWNFGRSYDERRRVLAAADFLIENRPDLSASDKTILAIDSRRKGEKGLGGAVAQYARPRRLPMIIVDLFPILGITGRGVGPGGKKELNEFLKRYVETGRIEADAVILEKEAIADNNPASSFWLRLAKDPNIRWIARFKEDGGEIFVGEPDPGKGSPIAEAKLMDVKSLSDNYLEKYDRLSFLKRNLEWSRLYFTNILSKQPVQVGQDNSRMPER